MKKRILKTGDRLWVYYVNEEVISACKAMKEKKVGDDQKRIDRIKKAAMDMKDGLHAGAVDTAQKIAGKLGKLHIMKNPNNDKHEE